MSIAVITSGFVTAVRERAAPVASTPAGAVADMQGVHKGGRRHELVDAMQQVLGVDNVDNGSDPQAVFRFAHALMHDLRKIEGASDGPTPGVGRAWGRRSYTDLPQRLEALAAAASAPAPATPPVAGLPVEPVPPTLPKAPFSTLDAASTAAAPVAPTAATSITAPATAADLPVQPDPLTATSAALHLMQVPTSRLLEAYTALRQALGDNGSAPSAPATTATPTPAPTSATTPDTGRAALAAFLTRLSSMLTADAPATLPTGSLLNVRA